MENPQFGKWQPIETAPKDGTRVLGLTDYGVEMVKYREADDTPLCSYDFFIEYSGWYGCEQDSECLPSSYQPTHWMPLPPPPKNTE